MPRLNFEFATEPFRMVQQKAAPTSWEIAGSNWIQSNWGQLIVTLMDDLPEPHDLQRIRMLHN